MDKNAKVKIPNCTTKFEAGKEVTFYRVSISLDGVTWEINKRFKEFHELNDLLKRNHGNLPPLPARTLLPVKKPEEIDRRRDGLEKYVQALLLKADIYANPTFIRFLELDEHKPDRTINPLQYIGRAVHSFMGY